MTSTIPLPVLTLRRHTMALYRAWWTAHYLFGFVGVVAGAVLTALTAVTPAAGPAGAAMGLNEMTLAFPSLENLHRWGWLIGIVAAVSTSLITFLGPLHKAERYWSAFHLLDQACLEFDQGLLDLRTFMNRVQQARVILQASAEPPERATGRGAPETESADAQAAQTAMQVKRTVGLSTVKQDPQVAGSAA